MLSRVVMRRNSREPVRTSGLLQTWLGCGRSFAVMTVSVSHTAFTKAFIVSIGRCSPMPWITTTACMSAWCVPADAGCAAWGELESLIGVQTNGMHRGLQSRPRLEGTMALQKSRAARPPSSASTGFEPGEFRRDRRLLTQVKVVGKHHVALRLRGQQVPGRKE